MDSAAIQEALQCPICGHFMVEPHSVSTCGHAFCFTCICRAIEHGAELLRGSSAAGGAGTSPGGGRKSVKGDTTARKGERKTPRRAAAKTNFVCPVCTMPAFRWMLRRAPQPVTALCGELNAEAIRIEQRRLERERAEECRYGRRISVAACRTMLTDVEQRLAETSTAPYAAR